MLMESGHILMFQYWGLTKYTIISDHQWIINGWLLQYLIDQTRTGVVRSENVLGPRIHLRPLLSQLGGLDLEMEFPKRSLQIHYQKTWGFKFLTESLEPNLTVMAMAIRYKWL